jgi:hypothetical protein
MQIRMASRLCVGGYLALLTFGAAAQPHGNARPDLIPPLPVPRPKPSELSPAPEIPKDAGPTAVGVDQNCMERLRQLGAKAEALPDIVEGPCFAVHAVRLLSVANNVALSPPATLQCSMAESVARWSNDIIQVSAKQFLGELPLKILIGTSYACRTQNGQVSAKLSEHAFANGLDVMGFALSGNRSVMIGATLENQQALFAAEVRQKACTYFTTVLGPGDAEHGNHLHVDQRQRSGNIRICQ